MFARTRFFRMRSDVLRVEALRTSVQCLQSLAAHGSTAQTQFDRCHDVPPTAGVDRLLHELLIRFRPTSVMVPVPVTTERLHIQRR